MGGNHELMNCSSWDNKKTGYTNNSGAALELHAAARRATTDRPTRWSRGISSGNCPTARGMTARNIDGTIP